MERVDNKPQERAQVAAFISDPINHELVRNVLGHLNLSNSYLVTAEIDKCIEYLINNRSPKVLIVDLSNSDLPLTDIQKIADVCEPGVNVLAVGTRNDVALFRELMRMGVYDYYVKPIQPDVLAKTIQSLLEGTAQEVMQDRAGKVITVIGSKGGVGATTIANNLGWILAEEKFRKVLSFDLDLQKGSSGLLFDIEPTSGLKDVLAYPERIDESFVEQASSKITDRYMLIHAIENLNENIICHPESIAALWPIMTKHFHYVIFDMPPVIDDSYRFILKESSVIYVVTEPTLAGIRDTVRLLNLINAKKNNFKVFVVMNKMALYNRGEINISDFEKAIDMQVSFVIPFDRENALIAINIGSAVVSIGGVIAEPIRQMADHLAGKTTIVVRKEQNDLSSVVNQFAKDWDPSTTVNEFIEAFQEKISKMFSKET